MSKSKKEGTTFGASRRVDVPPVMIGKMEISFWQDGHEIVPSSMIVYTNASDPNSTSKLRFFCKKNALGKKHLELNAFVVVGLFDALLRLTDQTYIRDWHWDVSACIYNASGTGDKPKRSKTPRFTPTSKEGSKEVRAMAKTDLRHAGASDKPPQQHKQGDETLDALDVQRRKEANLWWEQQGLKQPPTNIGPDGKVL